jgi:NAD kinase
MLRAIRQHWADGLPFYGLNTGHVGFLLNDPDGLNFFDTDLRRYRLPLLSVEAVGADGQARQEIAFNDCWLERDGGQTAWVELGVNGHTRLAKLVADGLLIATAAGSTGYARAMGASPLPFNAPLLTLAGSNVFSPRDWRPAFLTTDSVVTLRNLDPDKRPLRGFVDGVPLGAVASLTVRVSGTAAAELLFTGTHDPAAKLAALQFPQLDG